MSDKRQVFTGKESDFIDLDTAAQWTRNQRQAYPNQVRAHFFGRVILEALLAQPHCVGLRIYHALSEPVPPPASEGTAVASLSFFGKLRLLLGKNEGLMLVKKPPAPTTPAMLPRKLIIAGVSADGNDQLPGEEQTDQEKQAATTAAAADDTTTAAARLEVRPASSQAVAFRLAEMGVVCPTECSRSNALN